MSGRPFDPEMKGGLQLDLFGEQLQQQPQDTAGDSAAPPAGPPTEGCPEDEPGGADW